MKAIVAVDRNFAIGFHGEQLYIFPEDRKFFREMTLGHTIVAGRKTFECFPGKKALSGRKNVILTRSDLYSDSEEELHAVHSLAEALWYLRKIPKDEIFVVGGEKVYRLFLPYCDECFVTWVDAEYPADTYFPNLDLDPEWEMVWESPNKLYMDSHYRNRRYLRRSGGVSL